MGGAVLAFVFGLFVGSFLNVVTSRLHTGISFVRGRSFCFSCGKPLSWKELIPLISFIVQRRKCRGCGSTISWQYPLVEFLSGIIFMGIFLRLPILEDTLMLALSFLFYGAVFSILLVIAVYDAKHKIIPDGFVYTFSFLALAWSVIDHPLGGTSETRFQIIAAGPLLAAPFTAFWAVSKGRWMGLGDAKLALGIGWLLGISGGLVALMLGFWSGALLGSAMIITERTAYLWKRGRAFTMKSEIPFGPFLVFGTLAAWFFNMDIIRFSEALSRFIGF